MRRLVRALISYSHKDEHHRQSLVSALATALRNKELEIWSDHCITAGQKIDDQILAQLKEADVIFLLVSQDFIASDYCYKTELEIALERHSNERCLVVPIVVRPTDLQGVPFQGIKMLPMDARAVSTWENVDEAWLNVARGVRESIKGLTFEADLEANVADVPTAIRHRLIQSFDALQDRHATNARPGVEFGFSELDELTDGIWPGETAVIASRPEHGHVELAVAATLRAALKSKISVTVLSQRMAASQYSNRLMCSLGFVSRAGLSRGWLDDEDWGRVSSAIQLLRDAKIEIDDRPVRSNQELASKLKSVDSGKGHLLIVDGLEYVSSGSNAEERAIALTLSDYARSKDACVIGTLSLGASLENRAYRQPILADLSEWQVIEPYCAKIIFCYRDEIYTGENSNSHGMVSVLVAKSPDGLTGSTDLKFFSDSGALFDPKLSRDDN